MLRRDSGLLAIALLVAASVLLLQPFGFNQAAHYSLVKALASGTATIDAVHAYAGDQSYFHGHYYSNKAPGLAFFSLPFYLLLRAAGLSSGVHALTLVGAMLPAFVLLLLVRRVGDEWERGFGTAAAVTLGAGTLVLPFASLFFSHVLAALCGFAAFALLVNERRRRSRLLLVAAAGALAGLAVVVEYPLALVGFVVGLYAIARAPIVRRGLAYTGGVLVGVAPVLVYQRWAFGSFTHLAYSDQVVVRGKTGHDVVRGVGAHAQRGFHDVGAPRLRQALEVLFLSRGALRVMPVLALAVVGLVLLWRRGRRAEALAIAGVTTLIVGYDSGFVEPFGGFGPGPRYLIPMLPFLAAALALVFARAPLTSLGLALASVTWMVAATVTEPLLPNNEKTTFWRLGDIANTAHWFHRFADGDFTRTVLTAAGLGHGWVSIAPFLLVVCAALAFAAHATPWPALQRRDAETAACALAGYLALAIDGPLLLHHDRTTGGSLGAVTTTLLVAAVALTCLRVWRSGLVAAVPALPLLAFAVHPLAHHAAWAAGLALAVLLVTIALEALRLRARTRFVPRHGVPARGRL